MGQKRAQKQGKNAVFSKNVLFNFGLKTNPNLDILAILGTFGLKTPQNSPTATRLLKGVFLENGKFRDRVEAIWGGRCPKRALFGPMWKVW